MKVTPAVKAHKAEVNSTPSKVKKFAVFNVNIRRYHLFFQIVKPQKDIKSFFSFAKKSETVEKVEPATELKAIEKPSLPVVTPSEKVDDASVHITPASPNKKSTAIVITVEKQMKEDHKEVMEVSADEKEETRPQMSRRESISEDSSIFPTLEVDHGIERLVSSPSPLRCSTTSVDIHQPMPHEELSSFFISSPSATNISLDHSLRMGLLETSTNVSAMSESPKNLSEAFSAGSLRLIERTTTSPNKTVEKKEIIPIAMEIDTSSDYFQQQEENPATAVVDESLLVSPDNGRQSGRKRKPVNAFDPTPPTKPKKPRAKKEPAVVVVMAATEGDSTDATVTNVANTENLLSTSENPMDESNEANKSAKKAKTPAKPRTKTPKATPTGEVAPTDPNAPLTTTPAIPVTPVVVPPTPPPLPEEMKMKVDQINEKMTTLAEELVPTFELKAEYNDHELELFNDKFYADLLCVLRDPASFNLYFCPSAAAVVTATTAAALTTSSTAAVSSSEEYNNPCPSADMNATPAKPVVEVIYLEAENNAPTAAVSTPMDLCSPAPVSSSLAPSTTIVPPAVVMTPEEVTKSIVHMIVTRLIQGRSSTLSVLTTTVQSKFIPLIEWIEKLELIDENNNNCNTLRPLLLEELKKLSQPNNSLLLQTILTTLALRESYGFRARNSLSFEDLSVVAVYRWECHSMQFFSKASQAIIREIKTIRSKYSRTIKGFSKVIEQIYKTPQDLTKILPLEEKATKSLAEIEKTKEKRREFELKKALELEDKMKKQEVIEKKKREKEEADLKKKQELDAQQQLKNQVQLEKEKQEQAKKEKLAKQQNTFQNFFGKPAGGSKPITATTTSSSVACPSSGQTVDVTKNSSSVSSSPSSSMKPRKEVIDLDAEEQKHGQFIALVQKKHSFEEISQLRRQNRKEEKQLKRKFTPKESKKKPKTVKIQIFAENNNEENHNRNPFLMDEENNNYSELQERMVSNCMKTLSFVEDYRPAYYGTYSKKSLIISGRRPFAKDHELFHYEYDSEEEWEEEIEGEDIGESDGEEGDEDEEDEREVVKDKDGLMYDDFFRQDGDFGSDIDSDGEEIAAVALPNFARIKEEIAGLRFIEHQTIASWHQQSSTYFQPEEASSSQPQPKKDYVSNPTLLKGDSSKRNNGVSCSKYTLMKEEGEPVFTGISDCREDHECMQLMNYYAVVYNPTLLNLDPERFNQKNNEKKPKKKKATAKKPEEGASKTETATTSTVSSPSAEKTVTEGVIADPSKPVKEKKPRKKPEKKKTAENTVEGTATSTTATTTEEGASPIATTTTEKKKKPVKKLMEKILAEKRAANPEEDQGKETVDKKPDSTFSTCSPSSSSSANPLPETAVKETTTTKVSSYL
jgi:hypothetical protein